MDKKSTTPTDKQIVQDALDYPGIANDVADDEKCTNESVRQDVRELNNNPRNTDMEMP